VTASTSSPSAALLSVQRVQGHHPCAPGVVWVHAQLPGRGMLPRHQRLPNKTALGRDSNALLRCTWTKFFGDKSLQCSSSVTMTILTSTDMCAQADTKSNPNANPTTKQHTIVSIQLNVVTCLMYPQKFIQDNVHAPFIPT